MTGLDSALIRGDLRRMLAYEAQSATRALRRGITRVSQQRSPTCASMQLVF